MPNHVQNRITLDGDSERIAALLETIKNDKHGIGSIDFQKIIPMPTNIYRSDLGQEERERYGENNWYDWSIEHWHTKWPAYGYDEDFSYTPGEPLTFLTAWSAPHPILEKLAELFPEIEITHEWADEDIGNNCGRCSYLGGERTEEWTPDFEEEAVEFACEVWGTSPEDEGLLNDPDLTE
ncbi:MAG: hypothetical protein J5851_02565 [Oscillospiraceae bacterium]|nr:hypothetical protein [Oscillospiraceae bacterium]